jgi:hypothetical protein
MVKHAVAMMLGALAGVLLWHAAQWVRAQAHESEVITVETCEPGALVDCVDYETPAPIEQAPDPCKDWLADGGARAVLSQCLHGVARAREGERVGTRAIAGST